jgi:hypothetical protein
MTDTFHRVLRLGAAVLAGLALPVSGLRAGEAWVFNERSAEVGLAYTHSYEDFQFKGEKHSIAGGLAIGDLNGDGWDDIFAVTGYSNDGGVNTNPNRLFISQGDGSYTESASSWELDPSLRNNAGPLIADFDGDGLNDLAIGGVDGDFFTLYLNDGDMTFRDATDFSQIPDNRQVMGLALGDMDKDGDLDLMHARWTDTYNVLLMKNNGSGQFSDIETEPLPRAIFTPAFADINGDDWDDLLLSSDFNAQFGGSVYYLNDQDGKFLRQDDSVLTDENGMGGAIADYDNDGDLDWFVSSIYDSDQVAEANWGVSGNRLYQNDGQGQFTDVTDDAEVRVGFWGWGACFADFNNDMHLDLYHVNGFRVLPPVQEDEFENDPARLFINDGDGTFSEQSAALGVDDTGQGRAILCFDNDRDGDIDILVNNSEGPSRFFENSLDKANHYLQIKLRQPPPNADAIGAKIFVTAGGVRQMRQIMAGANVFSSHPTAQHFGLAGNSTVSLVEIVWPDRSTQELSDVAADQYLVVDKNSKPPEIIMKTGFE